MIGRVVWGSEYEASWDLLTISGATSFVYFVTNDEVTAYWDLASAKTEMITLYKMMSIS
jgi:hypothetical protein